MNRKIFISQKSLINLFIITLFIIFAPLSAREAKNRPHKTSQGVDTALSSNDSAIISAWGAVKFNNPKDELQNIYTLLSCAVVFKNWQVSLDSTQRGYNIGCVLLDPNGKLVFWARNCVIRSKNNTNHGEVQCIRNYIDQFKTKTIKGYTLYTSLEPCAMCAGMMTLQQLGSTVYAQDDPDFGNALQRLQFNSTSIGGFPPYPANDTSRTYRPVPVASISPIRANLDSSYAQYLRKGNPRKITLWLTTNECRSIYSLATYWFLRYHVEYQENQQKLLDAQTYFNQIGGSCYAGEK